MPIVISGALPKWRVGYHLIVCGFMAALLVGIAGISVVSGVGGADMGDLAGSAPRLIAGILFAALTLVVLVMLVRSRREIVRDFSCDGAELRFRTLGGAAEQVWRLSDIAAVRDSRGSSRGLGIGYLVWRRDRRRVILDYALPDVAALAIRLGGLAFIPLMLSDRSACCRGATDAAKTGVVSRVGSGGEIIGNDGRRRGR